MTLGMHPFNLICQMFNLCRQLALKCPKEEITGYQIESYSAQHCLNMDLLDITRLSGGPRLDLIRWLQGQNCLANPLRCSQCHVRMLLTARNQDHIDGYLWFVSCVFQSIDHIVVQKG